MAEACPDEKLARSYPAHHDDHQTAFDSLGSIKSPLRPQVDDLGTRLSLGYAVHVCFWSFYACREFTGP